jgi:hypothetical protein
MLKIVEGDTSTVEVVSYREMHQRLLTLFAQGWVFDQHSTCEVEAASTSQQEERLALHIDSMLGLKGLKTREPVEAKTLVSLDNGRVSAVAVCRSTKAVPAVNHRAAVQVGDLECLVLPWPSQRPLTWGYRARDLARVATSRAFADGENRFVGGLEDLASRAIFRGQIWQLAGMLHESGCTDERAERLKLELKRREPADFQDVPSSEHTRSASRVEELLAVLLWKTMETSIREAWEKVDLPF